MSRSAVAIVTLVVLLLGSNGWWLYRSIDFGLTHTYAMASCEVDRQLRKVYAAVLPVASDPDSDRASVIDAAVEATGLDSEPFEKDGYVWIGHAGISFSNSGKVLGVWEGW